MASTKLGWLGTLVASLALSSIVACQCDSTVDGKEDSGVDAGSDAGCAPVGFTYGQNVIVDAFAGVDDTKCACGSLEHPCKSLTYCMQLIAEGSVQNVTLHAQMSDGGPEWPVDLETWPIHLGWGVTLEAPDLYFNVPPSDGGFPVFQTYAFDAGDLGTVTIEGDPVEAGRYIHIGVPVEYVGSSSTTFAVGDPGYDFVTLAPDLLGVPLILSNVWAHGISGSLAVLDGASVQLGPLPVHFGTNGWQKILAPSSGAIGCYGFATVPQIFDTGTATVQIDDSVVAIAQDGDTCQISLTHGPRIGSQPQSLFDGGCPPDEAIGLAMEFEGDVTLGSLADPAVLSCQQQLGIFVGGTGTGDPGGVPRLNFTGNIINQRCFGLFASGGDTTLMSSTFQSSLSGIWLDGDASLYLSLPYPFYEDDATKGLLPVTPLNDLAICQQPYPNPQDDCVTDGFESPPNGALVAIEDPQVTVNLENVIWHHWDPKSRLPQVWTCTGPGYYSDCTCDGPDCPDGGPGPLQAGADVAYHYRPKSLPSFDGGEAGECE